MKRLPGTSRAVEARPDVVDWAEASQFVFNTMNRSDAARILRNEEHFPRYLLEEAKRVNPEEAQVIEQEIVELIARRHRR